MAFCRLEAKGKYVSQLIYSANTKLETAVQSAFVLGSKDIMVEAALYLRNAILYDSTVEYLDNAVDVIPDELNSFLKYVFFWEIR